MTEELRVDRRGTKQSLRVRNLALVLQSVAAGDGAVSRADIRRSTGLPSATVSEVIADLVERKVVREVGQARSSGGKPATLLALDRDHHLFIGVHVGRNQLVASRVTLGGRIQETVCLPYQAGDNPIPLAAEAVAQLCRDGEVSAIGLATPGVVTREGVLTQALNYGWSMVPFGDQLSKACAGLPVHVINDSNAVALSEVVLSDRSRVSLVLLWLGTGIGAGIVLEDRLYEGHGHRAGEIGHIDTGADAFCICGRTGCLEAIAALHAIVGDADDSTVDEFVRGRTTTHPARRLAHRVRRAAKELARLVTTLEATLDVADFIIGGPMATHPIGPSVLAAVNDELSARTMPGFSTVRVEFSEFGAHDVVIGAAAHAMCQELGVMVTLPDAAIGASAPKTQPSRPNEEEEMALSQHVAVRAAAVALTASLATAGCGTDSDTLVVEVWTHEFAPLQKALQEKWIPEYEKANPGTKIKLTSIPFAGVVSYDSKLLSALSSGKGPDVWDMGDWNYSSFNKSGFLEPIDAAAFGYGSDKELIDAYQPGATKAIEKDGKLYGLFSEFNTLNLFYNTEVFEKAGIPPLPADKPVSWEQLGAIGQKLRVENGGKIERTGFQFGFFANFRSPQWYAQNFYTLMRQYGQDDLYVDGKPAATSEAVVKAFKLIHDYTFQYKAYDPTFLNNWFADVPQGRAAMVQAGTWYPASAKESNPNFKFAVAPNPVVNPDDPSTYQNISWLWGWSVNAKSPSPQKAAAQKFLAFVLGKKGETAQAAYWFEHAGFLQPSKAFLESDAYQAALKESPWLKLWIDAFDKYKIAPVPHSYDEPGAALVRAIDRVIYDKVSPSDAAQSLQQELSRLDTK
ncbi:ROK family protein [Actinokineospora sp. HUAS TT18]|uniref:ROK family protein n=1 Tax=Actinokineospora sp. HUAS TT18 TaxID=3447451 RepID=UPI003F524E91